MSRETLDTLEKAEIIEIGGKLLNATIESSGILEGKPFTKQSLQEAKLVGAMYNSRIKGLNFRMSFFELTGVVGKVKALKKHAKS